ncbi:MAG: type I DNA topoisomerase [Bacillota bacterium]|nr:type I DNA topoisomerase [Bacillota bacterium]
MERPLIIVESPAKARTIEKFLGRRYKVKASVGHLIDLPKSQLGVDPDQDFAPKYITIRGKTKILKELRDAAKAAPRVLLATDPDREGEAIAWHLARALELGEQGCRVEFREITKEAVTRAIQSPRDIDIDRVNAQQARRILDRLVGYKLSPLLWRKVQRGLSAGRVQSVAVRLIVDREAEIRAFVREEYWSVTAWVHRPEDRTEDSFPSRLATLRGDKVKLATEADAHHVLTELEGQSYRVAKVARRARRRQPPPAFTTSTLQQEAARRFGFAPRRSMQVAQQLYEGLDLGPAGRTGLITYIRTDSTRVAAEAVDQAKQYVEHRFGSSFVGKRRASAAALRPSAQDAHEAIRPTLAGRTPDEVQGYLNTDQLRIYRLIWERFIGSQMAAAVYDVVSVDIGAGEYVFRASGQTVRFAGFTIIHEQARPETARGRAGGDEDQEDQDEQAPGDRDEQAVSLPEIAEGQELTLSRLEPKQHFTQPPPRYSEASLVKTLEDLGIGRPSTYHQIAETIQQRGYTRLEERRFHATPLGETVTHLLAVHFPDIVDVAFTAKMEASLDQVERGDADWLGILHRFYGPFVATLENAERNVSRVRVPAEETDIACDKCGRMMVIKHGRYGAFLACPGFPECRHTRPIAKKVQAAECPLCGRAILERKSKRGRRFYGCEGYPECTFTSWNKPLPQTCPECNAFLVQKRNREQGTYYACSRDGCEFETKTLRGLKPPGNAAGGDAAGGSD